MTNQFRLPADVLRGWHAALVPHRAARGMEAVLKEIESAAAKESSDGHVVVSRHQLFTWGQSLDGMVRKVPLGAGEQVQHVADDVKSYLADAPRPAAAASAPRPYTLPSSVPPPVAPAAETRAWTPAPPVVYSKAAAASDRLRLVRADELQRLSVDLLAAAREEVLIVTPWRLGLDSLVDAILRTNPQVRVRILTRRPEQEDTEYHRRVQDLHRRKVEMVMSPLIQTRMIVQDRERVLLGAASVPRLDVSREVALLTTDDAAIVQAREHFERAFAEARGV